MKLEDFELNEHFARRVFKRIKIKKVTMNSDGIGDYSAALMQAVIDQLREEISK